MSFDEIWERLNEYQRCAVEDDSRACVVNANVGSGKTTVLIAKILYLHEKKHVPVGNMTVLTFTNKAAGEIRDRLLSAEPGLSARELDGFGTFHSVAMNCLKNRLPIEELGFTKDFMIMDPEEEVQLALRIAKDRKYNIKYKNRLKKRLEQEYDAYCQGKETSRCGDDLFLLFQALKEEKRRLDKMTFSDLIETAAELFSQEKHSCENNKPDWIIVDEVQDSDRKQVELIRAMMGEHTRLFAVGDPNQLIYSWRGGTDTMLFYLKNQFQAKELTLSINYRSSAVILEAAGRFLQFGSRVTGEKGGGDPILIRNHYDAFQEARYLAQRIRSLHENGLSYGEIAVFYRLQSQSELLEKVLGKENIPFTVTVKKTLSDVPVLSWFLKVLQFSCCPNDLYAAEAALTHPMYGEGHSAAKVRQLLAQKEPGKSALYDKMCSFSADFSKYHSSMPKPEEVYDYFPLDFNLKPNRESFGEDRQMIVELCRRLISYCQENQLDFVEGTRQFLNSSALYGIQILKEDIEPSQDKVRLMTLHASKGLEFSYVFIIGVNQGLIPLRGKSYEEEEEERRLFFVGMTRARDHLELSYYTSPGIPGTAGGPGRYLQMIPEHLTDWKERRNAQDRQANLQQLRKAVREERISSRGDIECGEQGSQEIQETEQMEQKIAQETSGLTQGTPKTTYVRHKKYGIGRIEKETELTVEVCFEKYGTKEFMKAFGELEFIDDKKVEKE